jgi:hypothetical protein
MKNEFPCFVLWRLKVVQTFTRNILEDFEKGLSRGLSVASVSVSVVPVLFELLLLERVTDTAIMAAMIIKAIAPQMKYTRRLLFGADVLIARDPSPFPNENAANSGFKPQVQQENSQPLSQVLEMKRQEDLSCSDSRQTLAPRRFVPRKGQ